MSPVLLVAAIAASGVAAPPPAPKQLLAFKGAQLGLSLDAWKALPFPAVGISVRQVCTGDADATRIGLTLSSAERQAGDVACTYAFDDSFGPGVRKPVPIDDQFIAQNVRYRFHSGHLAQISYQTSIDAFDAIVARIESQVGKPVSVQRDTVTLEPGAPLQRVRMRWAGPSGTAVLTDPAGRADRLSVTFELTPATPSPSARHG